MATVAETFIHDTASNAVTGNAAKDTPVPHASAASLVDSSEQTCVEPTCVSNAAKDTPVPHASAASLVDSREQTCVEQTCVEPTCVSNADTPIHAVSSLMDSKLADIHAVLENHTESLQKVLQLLELLESRLVETSANKDQKLISLERPSVTEI